MSKTTIIWNPLQFRNWTPATDITASILAVATDGTVVSRPPIDTSSFMSSALTSGYLFVGNGSNIATGVPLTGDIAITNAGVSSIGAGKIVDAQISASAAIQVSKLVAQTASRVATFDSSGYLTPSTVNTTTLAFLDATSSIQTQLNTKLTTTITSVAAGDMLRYSGSAWVNFAKGTDGYVLTMVAGVPAWANATPPSLPMGGTAGQYLNKIDGTDYNTQWSTLTVSKITDLTASAAELNIMDGVTTDFTHINYLSDVTSLIQSQLNAKQATITGGASTIASSNLATNFVLASDGSGKVVVTATTTTVFAYASTLVSDAQAQINNKQGKSLTQNAIWIGNVSNVATELAPGTTGYVLTSVSGVPTWQPASGGGGGGITGPGSSTDNAITRWDGVLGTTVQDSSVTVDDTGIIAGGTWQGNKIGLVYGGTNADLSGTGGAGKYLKQASVGAAITVATITASEIGSGAALTASNDTNVTLSTGGSASSALLAAASITAGWTGTLAYARFVNGAGLSVVGRSANSSGVQADITAGTDAFVLRRSGTSIGFGTIGDASISALAFSKLTSTPTTLAGYGILDAANKYWTLNPQGGNYTFVLTDADTKLVQATSASSSTFTIPPNASVAYPTGTQLAVVWDGAGTPSFAAGAGVTIESSSGDLTIPSRYSIVIATKIATNTWYLWNGAAFATQSANKVFAGPTTGSAAVPTFRALVAADIPALPYISTAGGSTAQIQYNNAGALGGFGSYSGNVISMPTVAGSTAQGLELKSGSSNIKLEKYLGYSSTYSGGLIVVGAFDTSVVPNNCMFTVIADVIAIQTSGTPGSSGFGVRIRARFRKNNSGTLVAVGSSVLENSDNDTGDTFTSTPALIVFGTTIGLSVELSTSKTLSLSAWIEAFVTT